MRNPSRILTKRLNMYNSRLDHHQSARREELDTLKEVACMGDSVKAKRIVEGIEARDVSIAECKIAINELEYLLSINWEN